MTDYTLSLKRVMLLQKTLEGGGFTTCPLQRPEATTDALIQVENDHEVHRLSVRFGPLHSSITLKRRDAAKYLALRDFLQDVANGRADSGTESQAAASMRDALESVNSVLEPDQVAYITPTTDKDRPFRVIVLDVLGDICAHTKGHCKDHLAEAVRTQLRPQHQEAREPS